MAKLKTVTGESAVLERVDRIRQAVNDKQTEKLIEISPLGFVSDRYRHQAWPMLLGLDVNSIPNLDDEAEIDQEIEKAALERAKLKNQLNSLPVHEPIVQSTEESTYQSSDVKTESDNADVIDSSQQSDNPTEAISASDDESKQSINDDEANRSINDDEKSQSQSSQSQSAESRSTESHSSQSQSSHDSDSVGRIPHPYQNEYTSQIEKDVDRSLNHFTELLKWPEARRHRTRLSLNRLIQRVFAFNPDLHYIQGFHDIASVFLLSLDDFSLAFACLNQLATTRLTKSLQPSIQNVLTDLDLLFPLLKQADSELYDTLIERVPQAWFTLSWVLTWFAHNVSNQTIASHWFDFFLASPPLMPVYAIAAITRANRSELIESINQAVLDSNADESQARVHQFFQHFDIVTHEQVTDLALEARSMYDMFPPSTLKQVQVAVPKAAGPGLTLTQQKSRDLVEHLLGSNLTGAIKAVSSTNQLIGSVLLVGAVGVALAWAGPFSRGGGGGQPR